MKASRFSEAQKAFILKQVRTACRRPTFVGMPALAGDLLQLEETI